MPDNDEVKTQDKKNVKFSLDELINKLDELIELAEKLNKRMKELNILNQ